MLQARSFAKVAVVRPAVEALAVEEDRNVRDGFVAALEEFLPIRQQNGRHISAIDRASPRLTLRDLMIVAMAVNRAVVADLGRCSRRHSKMGAFQIALVSDLHQHSAPLHEPAP